MPLILHPGSAPCHLVCRKIQIFKPKFRSDRQMTRPIHAISGAVASLTRRRLFAEEINLCAMERGLSSRDSFWVLIHMLLENSVAC